MIEITFASPARICQVYLGAHTMIANLAAWSAATVDSRWGRRGNFTGYWIIARQQNVCTYACIQRAGTGLLITQDPPW